MTEASEADSLAVQNTEPESYSSNERRRSGFHLHSEPRLNGTMLCYWNVFVLDMSVKVPNKNSHFGPMLIEDFHQVLSLSFQNYFPRLARTYFQEIARNVIPLT